MRKPAIIYNWWLSGGAASDPDALAFFAYMESIGSAVPDNYKARYTNTIIGLKNTKGRDGVTSLWDSTDALFLRATYSKTAALADVKRLLQSEITNDHGASFTVDKGLKGNGTNFRVNTKFNPTTATRYSQNSASIGVLVLEDKTGDDRYELSSFNAAANSGIFLWTKRSAALRHDTDYAMNEAAFTGTVPRTTLSSRSWYCLDRPSSSLSRQYINGVLLNFNSKTSAAPTNFDVYEFGAAVPPSSFANFSDLTHSVFWAGNANIESNLMIKVINDNFLSEVATNAYIPNRLFCIGDSMTGDNDNTVNLSQISEYSRRTLSNLQPNWVGLQNGKTNRQIFASTLTPSLYSIWDNEIVGTANGQVGFRNTSFTNDVYVFWIGTNDLALNAVSTGTVYYDYLKTKLQEVKNLGHKVILMNVIDRRGGFAGGQTQGNFNLARASFNSLFAADSPTATSVSGVTTGAAYLDYYIDLYSFFNDATNTTYFDADLVHLNTVGFDVVADNYLTPTIQLF